MAMHRVMGIADVFAIDSPVEVWTRAGMAVIGQRQACNHPNGGKLRVGTFAICLSRQMTTN